MEKDNLFVQENTIFYVESEEATMDYGTVVLEENASIEIRKGGIFNIDQLKKQTGPFSERKTHYDIHYDFIISGETTDGFSLRLQLNDIADDIAILNSNTKQKDQNEKCGLTVHWETKCESKVSVYERKENQNE